MQYLNIGKARRLMMALALFVGGTQTALAVGTTSGTIINNTATVDYQVGTDPRTTTGSAPPITVDNRVDLTVNNTNVGNDEIVNPAQANQVLIYTVTNTGNTTQGYHLSTDIPTANIPMGSVEIWLDSNGNGTWDGAGPGLDTLYTAGTNAFDLDPSGVDAATVFVVADTPAGAVDGNQDDVRLLAQTRAAGGAAIAAAGAPTAGVDIVYADGAGTTSDGNRDGQHSDAATYTVQSAALAAVKTIASTTDEFGTGFSIPGANVVYQIRVTNTGSTTVDANTVSVTDPVPANSQLCVSTVASCTAPSFTDGATSSALAAAAFEYSFVVGATACDNASFVGTPPTADASGYDSTVTCVRQAPTGSMAGSGGFFDVQITVGIQ